MFGKNKKYHRKGEKLLFFVLFLFFISNFIYAELSIIKSSPNGKLKSLKNLEITVMFSDDMKVLGKNRDISGYIKIKPFVKGVFKWRGNSIIVFRPYKRFKYSTEYSVIIKRGLKSLNGKILKKDYSFKFQTPRPFPISIKQESYWYDFYENDFDYSENRINIECDKKIETDKPIYLKFNQIINKKTNLKKIKVYDAESLTLLKTKSSFLSPDIVKIDFQKAPGKEKKYFIKIIKGLKSAEGKLLSDKHILIRFNTEEMFKYTGEKELFIFKEDPSFRLSFNKTISDDYRCLKNNNINIFKVEKNKKEKITDFKRRCSYHSIKITLKSVGTEGDYLINIPPNFKDKRGEKLGKDLWIKVKVCGYIPDIKIAKFKNNKLYIDTKGIERIKFTVLKVKNQLKFAESSPVFTELFTDTEVFHIKKIDYRIEDNKTDKFFIDMKKLFGTGKGIFIIKISDLKLKYQCKITESYKKSMKNYWRYIINSPDIYSSALSLRDGTFIVSGNRTDLSRTPYVDFYLFSNKKLLFKTKTNKQGLNFINKKIKINRWYFNRNKIILLKKGDDLSFSYAYKNLVSSKGSLDKTRIMFSLFTDREFYLPGEIIHFGGIVKKTKNNSIISIKDKNWKLSIKDPKDKVIKTVPLNFDSFGGFFYNFNTKKNRARGRYTFIVKKGEWESAPVSVKVDFFKSNIIELTSKPEKSEIIAKEKNRIFVRGSYLSGAPMINNRILLKTKIISSADFFLNKLKKYYKEYDFNPRYLYKQLKSEEKYTDSSGKTSFSICLGDKDINSLSRVGVETIGISNDGKEYSVRKYFNYIPSDAIVGIKTPYFVRAGKSFNIKLLALNGKGEETTANIKILIQREYWKNRKLKSETIINKSLKINKSKIIKYKFHNPGYYKIIVSSMDSKGNKAITESGFYVWSSDYNFTGNRVEKINLKKDKELYNIGDTARIYISSPERGKGYVILFTDITEEKYFIDFNKTTEFSFKIKENYFPSVGLLVAVHYKDKNGKRKTKVAYTRINVINPDRKIFINLTVPQELSPLKEYSVKIKTENYHKKGIRAKLFVFAVDEGILSLSSYKTPDPFSIFYSPKDFPYAFYDTFSNPDFYKYFSLVKTKRTKEMIRGRGELFTSLRKQEAPGGAFAPVPGNIDKIIKDIRLRNLFKTTLFFKKIETDKKGNALLKFRTSDLLSTYRLIAIAYNHNMFGSADKRFRVSKKLLMKESYPDFLRAGDTAKAGIIITNRTDKRIKVKIILKTDDKIKVEGDNIKDAVILPMSTKTVYFSTRAEKEGTGIIKFYAISDKFKDGIEKRVEIKEGIIKQSFIDFQSGKSIQKKYELVKSKKPKLKLIFSSSIIDSSFSIAKKLIFYPYECLEQRTSKLFPFLIIDEELYDYGDFKFDKKNIKKRIREYLKKLPFYENRDGGLGYYEKSKSSPYLTSYVLYALKLIREKGYKTDGALVERLLGYIDWYGKEEPFTLYVKALWGKNIDREVKKNYAKFENLSLLSKSFLLKALKLSKLPDKERMIKTIIKDFEKYIFVESDFAYFKKPQNYDFFEYPFYSNKYITAVILGAILDSGEDYVLSNRMIKYIVEEEKNPWWWFSTHTNVWTIYAINQYVKKVEKGFKKKIDMELYENSILKLKKTLRFVHPKQKYTQKSEAKNKDKTIELSAKGDSLFYLTSELNQAVNLLKPENNGIKVERKIYNEKGEEVKKLIKGNIYQVVLKIETREPMDYVVIDEPLIGGVMVLRGDIKTTRELFDFRKIKKNYYWWWGVKKKTYKKDRIVFYTYRIDEKFEVSYHIKALYSGKYTLLPASAFSMYHPQFNGREKKMIVKIR